MLARYFFVLTTASCFATSAIADEPGGPDWNAATLTGDWGGTRSNLYNKGIDLEFTHKSDFMSDTAGGIKRGSAWMGHTEARVRMDLAKLADWNDTTAYLHYHSQLGSKFNRDYAGSFVGVDNIETSVNTAQFYQAWIQKSYAADSLSLLFGLYAVDSEFYVTDTSGVFIQPPHGMANEMAQSGKNGPPIFPMGALAVRVKYTSPGKNAYVQYALTDGVPGDPNNPYGTHIQLNQGDGTLSVVEFGYTPQESSEPPVKPVQPGELKQPETSPPEAGESFNKTAVGLWHYSATFADLDPAISLRRTSEGCYFLAERTLMTEKDHPAQGLSGFVRFGTASRDVHQADWTESTGLRYHGLFEGRDDDIAGIAITWNHTSDKFRQLNIGAAAFQTEIEATYRAQLRPWFALQPTLQYVANPNMKLDPAGNPTLQNLWVIGARAEFNL